MIASNAIELVRAALIASFWRKDALRRFLRRAHVAESALANLNGLGTKREFIDWLIPQLERSSRGTQVLRLIANELAAQTRFPDLEGWEDSEIKKRNAKEAVAALASHLDSEAKTAESESQKKTRREAAERDRQAQCEHDRSLTDLRSQLDRLASQLGTQAGGYAFQDWIVGLCRTFDLDCKKSYRAGGRETDGSVTVGDMTYLLSAKFENHPTAPADVSELKGRLHKVADYTMGLLVSMAGFQPNAVEEASGSQSSILLIDHSHLYYVLSGAMSLPELIARIRRHASRTGVAYLPLADFGK